MRTHMCYNYCIKSYVVDAFSAFLSFLNKIFRVKGIIIISRKHTYRSTKSNVMWVGSVFSTKTLISIYGIWTISKCTVSNQHISIKCFVCISNQSDSNLFIVIIVLLYWTYGEYYQWNQFNAKPFIIHWKSFKWIFCLRYISLRLHNESLGESNIPISMLFGIRISDAIIIRLTGNANQFKRL